MKKGIIQVVHKQRKMKGILFFFFSLLIISPCSAQTTKIWDKVLGGIYTETPVLISTNPSGTVDVIASVAGAGNPAGNAQGFDVTTGYGKYDYWFCKLDKSGQKIPGSDRTYGGSENDEAVSAIRTNDGGYLICGKSYTPPIPAANTSVLWVVKIDTMGNVQWKKQVDLHVAVPSGNGVCNLTGHMAACNTSTGYAIVVSTHSPGPTSNYFTFLVLYDLAGNQAPPVNINPGSSASTLNDVFLPRCISQMSNGNLLLGGSKNSQGHSLRLTGSGTTTIFATQLASNGASAIISAKELANGRILYFQKSIHDNMSGSVRTVNSKASSGNYDIWTFQTAANGSGFTNESAIGCGALNLADNASILELSNVFYNNNIAYLLLEPNATGLDRKGANKGSTDYWLVEYDYTTNKVLKENSFGGSGSELVQSLVLDNDFTNAYLLGTSTSTISGDKTEALKSGTSDLWVVKSCLSAAPPIPAGSIFFWGTHFFMVCSGQKVTINLASTRPDYIYKWYDAASGGNLVWTGTSFTTPIISTVSNWWVEPNNGNCTGPRVPVSAIPITTPSTPTVFGSPLVCKGENVMLIARRDTAPQPGQSGQFFVSHWYDSTGTKLLSTRDTLIIPNIQKGIKILLSTIDSIPANPQFGWPAFICESQKFSYAITVQDVPVPIVQYTNPDCIYTPTTLTVSNSGSNSVNWYDASNVWLHSGNPLIYTNSTLTDIIYCELVTVNGCVSAQKQLTVTAKYDTVPRPNISNTFMSFGQNIYPTCSNSSATINVANPNSLFTYNWYDAPVGGNLVHVGNSLTIPNINLNSNYEYFVCANNGYCLSSETNVLVKPIKTPGLPKIVSTVTTLCKNETLILIANKDTSTQPGGIFFNRWYNAANQLLHTGDTLKVPNIQTTSTFYCATVDSVPYNYFPNLGPYLCEGPKISKQIIVDTVISPIIKVPNPVCKGFNIPLNVTNAVNCSIKWYSTNGSVLSNSPSYTIPYIQKSDTLYTQATGLNSCKSKIIQTILKPEKPFADFSASKTVLKSGDIMQFPNLSMGANKWSWDFGDGSTSTSQNPWHYFYNPGYYNITLVAISANGCVDTAKRYNYIQVVGPTDIDESSVLLGVKLFPNPFTEGVWIDVPVHLNTVKVTLKNMIGQDLRHYNINDKEFIQLNDLTTGIYILQIVKDNEVLNIKIIKE